MASEIDPRHAQASPSVTTHFCQHDFMQPALMRQPVGALLLDREVLARDAQDRLAFVNEWARPNDVGGCAHTGSSSRTFELNNHNYLSLKGENI
jgi:hypothetical protein